MATVKAKYTIERISQPRQYLATDDDGSKIWGSVRYPCDVFNTLRAAKVFRAFRMGAHGDDARIVRHSVH